MYGQMTAGSPLGGLLLRGPASIGFQLCNLLLESFLLHGAAADLQLDRADVPIGLHLRFRIGACARSAIDLEDALLVGAVGLLDAPDLLLDLLQPDIADRLFGVRAFS